MIFIPYEFKTIKIVVKKNISLWTFHSFIASVDYSINLAKLITRELKGFLGNIG